MIYVYGVLEGATEVPPLRGLDDAPVEGRRVGGLALAVSEHATRPELTDEAVIRHARVVDELAASGEAILPARFGTAFDDAATLEREVGTKADELHGALDRVRGCTEVGLRVLRPERETTPTPRDGADYLRARLRESSVAGSLHDALARHARDSTRRASPSGRLLLDAAYLVPLADVEVFRKEVGELGRAHPELALLCTGPWPPYSFAPAPEAAL